MAVYFDSAVIYINGAIDLCDKIKRIDAIITALETSALTAAATGAISEYSLDDGQTKIREVYRSVDAIANSILAFKKIRQGYINDLNPRVVRLVDGQNFR